MNNINKLGYNVIQLKPCEQSGSADWYMLIDVAVIKIEIDPNRSDRIFMHQNDDDYRLAEEFADKHSLSSSIVPHIHDRIRLSRIAILQSSKVEQKKV